MHGQIRHIYKLFEKKYMLFRATYCIVHHPTQKWRIITSKPGVKRYPSTGKETFDSTTNKSNQNSLFLLLRSTAPFTITRVMEIAMSRLTHFMKNEQMQKAITSNWSSKYITTLQLCKHEKSDINVVMMVCQHRVWGGPFQMTGVNGLS